MPMNNEGMREVNNLSLPFPLIKHVGTCIKKIENRDEYAIRHCISVPMANRTANDWRVSGILRTETKDEQGEHVIYVAIRLQHDRLLEMGGDMEVAVEYFPLFRYANTADDMKNPSTVWIDEKCLESLTLMETDGRKIRHLKIRNGRCKTMALMQFVKSWIAEQTDLEISIDESKVKQYIESLTNNTYQVYAIDNLDEMSTADFGKVVRMIYGLHARTNTSSCMVKGDAETMGADYYDGFLHPFHCYRTNAWTLLLVSDKTPEQMGQVDFADSETKSPFLARAWATTCGTGLYYTWKFYGADNAIQAIKSDKEIVLPQTSPTDEELRLYKDASGEYVCAYIDGRNSVGVNSYRTYRDVDGNEYIIGYACEQGCEDYEDEYEPQYNSGLTEQRYRTVYCEIYGENYAEEECEYSHEIGGYVHNDFWDSQRECLNGYAIYRYYN